MFDKKRGAIDPAERQATIAELRRRMAGDHRLNGELDRGTADRRSPDLDAPDRDGSDRGGSGRDAPLRPSGYLPMIEPLAALLPGGGLPRGGVVSLVGRGATSLLFTLLSGPTSPWTALVGWSDLGLRAAAEIGVDLGRLVLIPDPGVDVLQVLSVLADGVDVLAVRVPGAQPGSPARLRVLQGRLRQRGTVMIAMGNWPGADLALTVSVESWRGIGDGHGRLTARELQVEVGGRGAAGRTRSARLLLAADRGGRIQISAVNTPAVERVLPAAAGR